ncbi:low-density lipoprotein receptor-related protein 1B-like [Microtus oregoni]|uniref:low-density lipoprotein receptor-related protein 1B-like n=1 Tax=Microtus oregoni TaxID=111838 RepID=UPI001BB0D8AE|nr:low-density lipoprotein receptor-related protein 1B-like [Microtus oregoni]
MSQLLLAVLTLSGLLPNAKVLTVGADQDQQSCDPGEFLCHDHVTCVSQSWLCDGDPDCPDESDESLATCRVEFDLVSITISVTCCGQLPGALKVKNNMASADTPEIIHDLNKESLKPCL